MNQTATDIPNPPPGYEACARCSRVGPDRRTLWMACFATMHEERGAPPYKQLQIRGRVHRHKGARISAFSIPIDTWEDEPTTTDPVALNFYTLCVCKDCRATWMTAIAQWFAVPKFWPYGPPSAHESCCSLFFGRKLDCDCKASDSSDDEHGIAADGPPAPNTLTAGKADAPSHRPDELGPMTQRFRAEKIAAQLRVLHQNHWVDLIVNELDEAGKERVKSYEASRKQPQIGLRYVKETSFGRAPIATNMHDLVQEEARAKKLVVEAEKSAVYKEAKAREDLADQLLIEKAAARHIDKCNDRIREIMKQDRGFDPNSPAATLIFNDLLRAQLARMGAREQRNSRRRVELGQQKSENLARIKSLEKKAEQLRRGLEQEIAESNERLVDVATLKKALAAERETSAKWSAEAASLRSRMEKEHRHAAMRAAAEHPGNRKIAELAAQLAYKDPTAPLPAHLQESGLRTLATENERLKAELDVAKDKLANEHAAHMIALTSRPAAEKLAKSMLDQAISKVPVTDLPPITPAEEARKIAERVFHSGKVFDPEARILSIETNHITELKPVGLSGHEERVSTGRTEQRLKARCPCGVTFDLVRMTHPEAKIECVCGAVYFVNASKGELTTMEPSPAAKSILFSLFSKEEPGKPPTTYSFEGNCHRCGHSNRWIGQPAKTVLRCAQCATSIGVDMNAGTITAAY